MSLYRVALLALFVVAGALVVAVPSGATTAAEETTRAAGATLEVADPVSEVADPASEVADQTRVGDGLVVTRPTADATAATAANNTTANSSLGTDISSFMQSSAAEVGGAVETGMWSAAFNATENRSVRAELVESQTSDLREELAELRQRRAELAAEREEGNLSQTAYKAKVSRLLGEINALRSAIDATTNRAESVEANVETLGSLRSETDNLTGPEIAAVARNVTGVGNGERGPPNGVGRGNGNGVGNGNGNGVGEGNGVGNGNGNGVGEGNGVGNGNGNGVGAGNGNSNAANAAKGAANGTTPGNAGEGNSGGNGAGNGNAGENGANGDDAGKGNDAGKGKGLSDAGNETGVGNGNNGVAGAGNGTDATNGTRGASGDAGTSLTTPDFLDRVSTALVAGTGPFSDGGLAAF